jgi:hypothetical protein
MTNIWDNLTWFKHYVHIHVWKYFMVPHYSVKTLSFCVLIKSNPCYLKMHSLNTITDQYKIFMLLFP